MPVLTRAWESVYSLISGFQRWHVELFQRAHSPETISQNLRRDKSQSSGRDWMGALMWRITSQESASFQWAIKLFSSSSKSSPRNQRSAGREVVRSSKCVCWSGGSCLETLHRWHWPQGPDKRARLGMAAETLLGCWLSFPSLSLSHCLFFCLVCRLVRVERLQFLSSPFTAILQLIWVQVSSMPAPSPSSLWPTYSSGGPMESDPRKKGRCIWPHLFFKVTYLRQITSRCVGYL